MPEKPPDHYAILGVSSTSTPEDIKKRYRELARRYHPDLNPDPAAPRKIIEINEAYRVLGDPDLRSEYDATIILSRAQTHRAAAPAASAQPPGPSAAPPGGSYSGRASYNGFGRTAPDDRPAYYDPIFEPPPRRRRTPPPEPIERQVERLASDAQMAFVNRRYTQAEELCLSALRLNHRNAIVHELLGDIYSRLGDSERAQTAFSFAVQFDPHNQTAPMKLERIMGKPFKANPGPTMTHPTQRRRRPAEPLPDSAIYAVSGLMTVLLAASLFLCRAAPVQEALDLGRASGVPLLLIGSLLLGGLSAGGLLAIYGGMRSIADELWPRGLIGDTPRMKAPLGVLLAVSAVAAFYISMLVYFIVAGSRNRYSPSILRLYGVTLLLVAVFSFVCGIPPGSANPLLMVAFSGNALFPAMLAGWCIGDAVRLRGRISSHTV
jgi:curved DNA-binding protein CbpA